MSESRITVHKIDGQIGFLEFKRTKFEPFYNVDDHSKDVKYRSRVTNERNRALMNKYNYRNKPFYDSKIKPIDIAVKVFY